MGDQRRVVLARGIILTWVDNAVEMQNVECQQITCRTFNISSYSMVVPSEPSTNCPLIKTPVLKETFPLKAGLSNSWVRTVGMVDESTEIKGMEGVYIGSECTERAIDRSGGLYLDLSVIFITDGY